MCVRCAKRPECTFRQPGTWIVECGLFEEEPHGAGATLTSPCPPTRAAEDRDAASEGPSAENRRPETTDR